jgi:hypothetical protein
MLYFLPPAAPIFRKDIRVFRVSPFVLFCRPHPHNECVSGVGKPSLSIDLHQDPDGTSSGGGGIEFHEQRMGWGKRAGRTSKFKTSVLKSEKPSHVRPGLKPKGGIVRGIARVPLSPNILWIFQKSSLNSPWGFGEGALLPGVRHLEEWNGV